ncbi:DUF4097 family beta strand repeat-containing protein [Goodfellowiella coeruleoviolacea]|uniref:DUF4097 family beta strand repeat-containing protein n=1 Tax=Goodfellowiella coeruleoviolacea TaxID=334858 RepID=UPI000AAD090C|nr:DUF4097 family beta strand repeat-containing protein [Goodfellowiella coeruleoviolacea]
MAAAAAALFSLSACGSMTGIGDTDFSDGASVSDRVSAVRLDTRSGDVRVVAREGATTRVNWTLHYFGERPEQPPFQVDNGTLVLSGCPETADRCSADYDVVVPAGTPVTGSTNSGKVSLEQVAEVELTTSSGDVTVRGVAGDVGLRTNSGAVIVSDVAGAVRLESNSGRVELSELHQGMTVRTGSGDVAASAIGGGRVDLDVRSGDATVALVDRQDVTAKVTSGDLTLTVPAGAYQVNSQTDSGDAEIGVTQDPTADHRLDLTARSGRLSVGQG